MPPAKTATASAAGTSSAAATNVQWSGFSPPTGLSTKVWVCSVYLVAMAVMVAFFLWMPSIPCRYKAVRGFLPAALGELCLDAPRPLHAPFVTEGLGDSTAWQARAQEGGLERSDALWLLDPAQHHGPRLVQEHVHADRPPRHAETVERSLFVLAAAGKMAGYMLLWVPITQPAHHLHLPPYAEEAGDVVAMAALLVMLVTTFEFGHFELFGVRQGMRGPTAGPPPQVKTPGLYRVVRHPMMLAFIIAFWAAPGLSLGRLLFASFETAWIVATLVMLEEPDLERTFGPDFTAYKQRVPMLVPFAGCWAKLTEGRGGPGPASADKADKAGKGE